MAFVGAVTTAAPASAGVRVRRGYLAQLLDRVAEERPKPHVLSVAAGHFREAQLPGAIRRGRLDRVVALDADQRSLEEVRSCYGRYGVETVQASRTSCPRSSAARSTYLWDMLTAAQRHAQVHYLVDVSLGCTAARSPVLARRGPA